LQQLGMSGQLMDAWGQVGQRSQSI